MINKVFNEDCLETMKRMPDKSIDLVLTDPPYGIGIDGQKEQLNNKNPKHNRKNIVSKVGILKLLNMKFLKR